MAIGAFPAAKLGILAIKQISKPIANIIKSNAKSSPIFRKYICMPPAQLYNWVEVKTKMRGLNLGKARIVPPLSEDMAIELGASLLGEFIIFTIGAVLLIFEYSRQVMKENRKLEAIEAEKQQIINDIAEVKAKLMKTEAQLSRIIADQESRSLFRWVRDSKILSDFVPIQDSTQTNGNKVYFGDYDPNSTIIYAALNYFQTYIFDNGYYKRQRALKPIAHFTEQLQAAINEAVQIPVRNSLAVQWIHLNKYK